MKTLCVKCNNKETISYLLEQFYEISLDNIYISHKKFKLYENFIIHYASDNIEYFDDIFASILANTIIHFYEKSLLTRTLNYNYFYFSKHEKNKILGIATNFLDSDNIAREDNYFSIYDSIIDYISENKSLILDGFVNFRLQKYINNIDYIIDIAVNKFLIDKEYNEFIDLLKLYISFTPSKESLVHLIYNNGESILLDSDKNIISVNDDAFNAKYLSDISFSSNDYALNTLLSLTPKRLIIHILDNNYDEFINTLKLIFDNKVEITENTVNFITV